MVTTGSLFTSSKPSIQQPYENHSIVNSHEVKGHISAEAKRTNDIDIDLFQVKTGYTFSITFSVFSRLVEQHGHK